MSTEYRITEGQGCVDVCMMLYIPSGMDLVPFNLTVFLGFSKGNSYFCKHNCYACTSPLNNTRHNVLSILWASGSEPSCLEGQYSTFVCMVQHCTEHDCYLMCVWLNTVHIAWLLEMFIRIRMQLAGVDTILAQGWSFDGVKLSEQVYSVFELKVVTKLSSIDL